MFKHKNRTVKEKNSYKLKSSKKVKNEKLNTISVF